MMLRLRRNATAMRECAAHKSTIFFPLELTRLRRGGRSKMTHLAWFANKTPKSFQVRTGS